MSQFLQPGMAPVAAPVATGMSTGKKIAMGLLIFLILALVGLGIGYAIWYFAIRDKDGDNGEGNGEEEEEEKTCEKKELDCRIGTKTEENIIDWYNDTYGYTWMGTEGSKKIDDDTCAVSYKWKLDKTGKTGGPTRFYNFDMKFDEDKCSWVPTKKYK